jgi:hypothetical protein
LAFAFAQPKLRTGVVGMLAGAVAFAVIVGLLAAVARSWAAPVMVAAVLALAALYICVGGLQVGLVALLIVTSVVDHYTFGVGPLALRPEQVAAVIALGAVILKGLREGSLAWIKPNKSEIVLLAWFLVGVVSSVLESPDKRLSAKILALIAICSLGFFLPQRLLAGGGSRERMEAVTVWLLIVFVAEAAYGVIAYLGHVFGPTISLTANPASGHLSAYGTLWEQNVFGAFAAAGAVAWVYLGPSRFRWASVALALCVGALFDSVTRAAWLAAALVGALGLALTRLRRRIVWRQVLFGGAGGLLLIVASLVAHRVANYNARFPPPPSGGATPGFLDALFNLVDVLGRVIQVGPAWADVENQVFLGRGIASYEVLHQYRGVAEHVASLPLLVFHDTGVLGLAIFLGFVVAVGIRVWPVRNDPMVAGLAQMAIVVGLTNLATETLELMIGWLLIGLLMAACDVASTPNLQLQTAPPKALPE